MSQEVSMNCFWVVWRENGGYPTYKHVTRLSAMNEAERLAISNPGVTFHVLQSMCSCSHKAPVDWVDHCDIPF